MHALNNTFINTTTKTYGEKGQAWLKDLPYTIDSCIKKWNLKNIIAYDTLTYNYVA